jgi:hypothetical protein
MIKVTNTIDQSKDIFPNMNLAKAFIKTEVKWFNSPQENKTGKGYDESDFIIDEIDTTCFLLYLESLDLFRWSIKETNNGFEGIVSADTVPKATNFTKVRQQEDLTWLVRLDHKDILNAAMTNGFFIEL